MAPDKKFEGWVGLDKDSFEGKMVWQEYEPKTFTDDDIDVGPFGQGLEWT